jgi:anti-sigma regulatory factor (Ser/Thr protein kinase)
VDVVVLDAASAVREARARTAAALRRWRCPGDRIEDAVLVVSEAATNAVQHGAGLVLVRLLRRRRYVRVEVQDNSPVPPAPLDNDTTGERGRGLTIIATLTERWGTRRTPSGKVVWAELPSGIDFGIDELAPAGLQGQTP